MADSSSSSPRSFVLQKIDGVVIGCIGDWVRSYCRLKHTSEFSHLLLQSVVLKWLLPEGVIDLDFQSPEALRKNTLKRVAHTQSNQNETHTYLLHPTQYELRRAFIDWSSESPKKCHNRPSLFLSLSPHSPNRERFPGAASASQQLLRCVEYKHLLP